MTYLDALKHSMHRFPQQTLSSILRLSQGCLQYEWDAQLLAQPILSTLGQQRWPIEKSAITYLPRLK